MIEETDEPGESSINYGRSSSSSQSINGGINTSADMCVPTKPLLLGFIYLSLRKCQSFRLPADIVHWCVSGSIPYHAIYDLIPTSLKENLSSKYKKIFKKQSHNSALTPQNIFYHTVVLAEFLQMSLPQLNEGLTARYLTSTLGLPAVVWDTYIKIHSLLNGNQHDKDYEMIQRLRKNDRKRRRLRKYEQEAPSSFSTPFFLYDQFNSLHRYSSSSSSSSNNNTSSSRVSYSSLLLLRFLLLHKQI